MQYSKLNVLVFCADSVLKTVLISRLNKLGFNTFVVENTYSFWEAFYLNKIDLVIFDINNKKNINLVFSLTKKIRLAVKIPLLILSENFPELNNFEDIFLLLKPFSFFDLNSKILSIFLNSNQNYFLLNKEKEILIYSKKKVVKIDSNNVNLTKLEFGILNYLFNKKKYICSKSIILKDVFFIDDSWYFDSNIIEMHISKLSRKINKFINEKKILIRKKRNYFFIEFNK